MLLCARHVSYPTPESICHIVHSQDPRNSVNFGRRNPLSGQYVDLCCEALTEAREYPTDFFLERTIRLIQVGDKISGAFGAPNDSERGNETYLAYLERNPGVFRHQLDGIMESLSDEQLHSHALHATLSSCRAVETRRGYFSLHFNYLITRLHEPATHLRAIQEQGGGPSELRSLRLRNCLLSVVAYFDELLALPAESLLGQPLTFAEQATFVMVVATRLLLPEADATDWDVEKARQTLDFSNMAGKLAEFFEETETARRRAVGEFVREMGVEVEDEETEVGGYYTGIGRNMRGIRDWFDAKLRNGKVGEAQASDLEEDIPEAWISRVADTTGQGMVTETAWFGGLLGNMAWNFDDM